MADALAALDSLTDLLDASSRPIYVVDSWRRIVYCNPALATWLELEPERIVGRLVEYHSEPGEDSVGKGDAVAPLADLCPPPRALSGEACGGTISCVGRDGRLVHRCAEFVPLGLPDAPDGASSTAKGGVLAFLAEHDLSPQELSEELAGEPTGDELHRAIRRFRRAQAGRYAIESLLGDSSSMRKVRAQVAVAAATGANVLIVGRTGAGRGHVGRAIHYRAAGDAPVRLVPIDCELAHDDLLRRALDAVCQSSGDAQRRPTLLLENLECLTASHQSQLVAAIERNALAARIVATTNVEGESRRGEDGEKRRETYQQDSPALEAPLGSRHLLDTALLDAVSTITIHVPRLAERLEDVPVLAQCFLEAANRGSGKQVGSLRSDALDLLALYTWPGELDELREVIAAAHQACQSHEVTPADLPAVVHHASRAAAHVRRQPERIVLDELLANIEKEAIVRALAQAGGNKTEAAHLLGMTRPRLYRRLVQLGLAGPVFVEQEPTDDEVAQ